MEIRIHVGRFQNIGIHYFLVSHCPKMLDSSVLHDFDQII